MNNSKRLKKLYSDWIMSEWSFINISNQVVEIRMPIFDKDSDYIFLYAELLNNGKIRLSDDGWTLDNLKSQSVSFTGRIKTKTATLKMITQSSGIEVINTELQMTTDLDKFPLALHHFLQAMIQINQNS